MAGGVRRAWPAGIRLSHGGRAAYASYPYDALGRRVLRYEAGPGGELYADEPVYLVAGMDGRTLVEYRDPALYLSARGTHYVWSPVLSMTLVCRDEVQMPESFEEGGGFEEGEGGGGGPSAPPVVTGRVYAEQDANGNVAATVRGTWDGFSAAWETGRERYESDPYGGNAIVLTDGFAAKTGGTDRGWSNLFQGGFTDSLSGLVHFGAREYDPGLGRWTRQDPLRYVDGANLYGFVRGSPVRYTDPTGLFTPPHIITIGGAMGIGAGLGCAAGVAFNLGSSGCAIRRGCGCGLIAGAIAGGGVAFGALTGAWWLGCAAGALSQLVRDACEASWPCPDDPEGPNSPEQVFCKSMALLLSTAAGCAGSVLGAAFERPGIQIASALNVVFGGTLNGMCNLHLHLPEKFGNCTGGNSTTAIG